MKWMRFILILTACVILTGLLATITPAGDWPTGRYNFSRQGFTPTENGAIPPFQFMWGYWAIDPAQTVDNPAVLTEDDKKARELWAPPVVAKDYLILCSRRSIYGFSLMEHILFNEDNIYSWDDSDFTDTNTAVGRPLNQDWKLDLEEPTNPVTPLTSSPWEIKAAPTILDNSVYVAANRTNTDGTISGWLLNLSLLLQKDEGGDIIHTDDLTDPWDKKSPRMWRWKEEIKDVHLVGSPITASITVENPSEGDDGVRGAAVIVTGYKTITDPITLVSVTTGIVQAYSAGGNGDGSTNKLWELELPEMVIGDPLLVDAPLEKDPENDGSVIKTQVLLVTTPKHVYMIAPGDFTYRDLSIDWKAGEIVREHPLTGTCTKTPMFAWVLGDRTLQNSTSEVSEIPETANIPLLFIAEEISIRPANNIRGKLSAIQLGDFTTEGKTNPWQVKWELNIEDPASGQYTYASCPIGYGISHVYDSENDIDSDQPRVFVGTGGFGTDASASPLVGQMIAYDALTGDVVWWQELDRSGPNPSDRYDNPLATTALGGPSTEASSLFIGTPGSGRMYTLDPASGMRMASFIPPVPSMLPLSFGTTGCLRPVETDGSPLGGITPELIIPIIPRIVPGMANTVVRFQRWKTLKSPPRISWSSRS